MKNIKKIALHWQILVAMLLGLFYSWLSLYYGWTMFTQHWLNPFGDLFIRLLKLLAIPIVLFSIISGMSNLTDTKDLGRWAVKMFSLYLLTTFCAILLGMGLTYFFKPGEQNSPDILSKNRHAYEAFALENDLPIYASSLKKIENFNISLPKDQTDQIEKKVEQKFEKMLENAKKTQQKPILEYFVDMVPENIFVSLTEPRLMIQVIFFALFFGLAMIFVPKTEVVAEFIDGFNRILMKMMAWVMKFSPFFVFCLIAGTFSKLAKNPEDLWMIFKSLSGYTLVIILGFLTLLFIIYPLMLKIFGRNFSAKQFFIGMRPAQLVGFSTSSSVATLPVSLQCVKENLKVNPKIADFVLPIGATVNMDGTSLYQGAAVLFLAQFHGIDLTWEAIMMVLFTTLFASIGASGIPAAGMVLLVVILESVHLDPYWIAIIAPVDRLLDMIRTVVNLTSDAMVSVVLSQQEVKKNKL